MIHTSQRSITAAQVTHVRRARERERENRLAEAVDGYLRAEAWREAARVLSALGRFAEAGEALLRNLPAEPSRVVDLAEELKRDVLNAALCFARGGARQECVGLLVNLGEHQRAAALLSAAGRAVEADRVSRRRPLRDNPWPPGMVFPIHKYLETPADSSPFAAVEGGVPWEAPRPSGLASDSPVPRGPAEAPWTEAPSAPIVEEDDPLGAAFTSLERPVAEARLGESSPAPSDDLPPIDDDFADPWGPPAPRPDAELPDFSSFEGGPPDSVDPSDPFGLPEPDSLREGGLAPIASVDPFAEAPSASVEDSLAPIAGLHGGTVGFDDGSGQWDAVGSSFDSESGVFDAAGLSYDSESGMFDAAGVSYDSESGMFSTLDMSVGDVPAPGLGGSRPGRDGPSHPDATDVPEPVTMSGEFHSVDATDVPEPVTLSGEFSAVDATDVPEPVTLSGEFEAARPAGKRAAPGSEEVARAPASPTPSAPAGPPAPVAPAAYAPETIASDRATYGAAVPGSSSTHLEVPRLSRLLETPPSSPQYAESAWRVVGFVWRDERLSRRVAHFLDEFVRRAAMGGADGDVRRTVYAAGRIFEAHDRPEAAIRSYTILGGRSRAFGDAALRLQSLRDGLAEADDGCWRPVRMMIQGLCDFASLPALETLPRDHDPAGTADREEDSTPGPTSDLPSAAMEELPPAAMLAPVGAGSAPAESLVGPGTIIADRYRVEGLIGTGGMASVFRAVDLELDDRIALKLFKGAGQNEEGLSRFRREMKLSRKLVHPNIVRTFEYGVWMGLHFITMELLQGEDLGRVAERCPGRVLPMRQLLALSAQACEGLAAAHAVGIVHRDVKPGNLYVTDAGRTLKVMDFGIAKSHTATTVSVTGIRIGTPRYMSPEQIDSSTHVGPSADLYSLGVVLYEAMTGRPVFRETSLARLLLCHLTEEPTPPTDLNAAIPLEVEAIVMRLLRKSPAERYGNCPALRQALLGAMESLPG